jgi:hypothetical protein
VFGTNSRLYKPSNPMHLLSGTVLCAGFLCLLAPLTLSSSALANPTFSADPGSLDFGRQKVGTTSQARTITFTNSGTGFLVVALDCTLRGSDSTDFVVAEDPGSPPNCLRCGVGLLLKPGARCLAAVRFRPASGGSKTAYVRVLTNDPTRTSGDEGAQLIPLTGTGAVPAPAVSLGPESLDFGSLLLNNASTPQTVRIGNQGDAVLTIRRVTITGTHRADFQLVAGGGAGSLQPGESRAVSIGFTPTAVGRRIATLTITDDAPQSPHTAPLTGTGIVASTPGIRINGSATQLGSGGFRLTDNRSGQSGSVWLVAKQRVDAGFRMEFTFRITNLGGIADTTGRNGGDGFAFVIQNFSDTAVGLGGGGLGYASIPNSLAVEFDTWLNGAPEFHVPDPSNNHISAHTNGTGANNADEQYSLGSTVVLPDLSSGVEQNVKIVYQPGLQVSLLVYLDDVPVLNVPLNLGSKLRLDGGRAWVGFTAATGGATETHDILTWDFKPF